MLNVEVRSWAEGLRLTTLLLTSSVMFLESLSVWSLSASYVALGDTPAAHLYLETLNFLSKASSKLSSQGTVSSKRLTPPGSSRPAHASIYINPLQTPSRSCSNCSRVPCLEHRGHAGVSTLVHICRLDGLGRTSYTAWIRNLIRWGSALIAQLTWTLLPSWPSPPLPQPLHLAGRLFLHRCCHFLLG